MEEKCCAEVQEVINLHELFKNTHELVKVITDLTKNTYEEFFGAYDMGENVTENAEGFYRNLKLINFKLSRIAICLRDLNDKI